MSFHSQAIEGVFSCYFCLDPRHQNCFEDLDRTLHRWCGGIRAAFELSTRRWNRPWNWNRVWRCLSLIDTADCHFSLFKKPLVFSELSKTNLDDSWVNKNMLCTATHHALLTLPCAGKVALDPWDFRPLFPQFLCTEAPWVGSLKTEQEMTYKTGQYYSGFTWLLLYVE